MIGNFGPCLALTLIQEGGNSQDAHDPGGRTSRGVIQTEYDLWRTKHGLPTRDVYTADDSEIHAIYMGNYWGPLDCDNLAAGVDLTVFDYGVNSGIYRSAWELQAVTGAPKDGDIGPITCRYANADPIATIKALNAERLLFLRGLATWQYFGTDWGRRVADMLSDSLKMTAPA